MYLSVYYSLRKPLRAGFIWPLVVLLFCLVSFFSPTSHSFTPTNGEAFISLESDSLSEPIPLHETRHHWRKGFKHGDEAYTHQLLSHGVRLEHWSIGVFVRYDYKVIADPDTLSIINLEENNLPLPLDRSYTLYARGSHSKSRGVFFDYHFKDETMGSWQVRSNIHYGYDIEEFELSGQGSVTADDNIVADLELDYYYGTDKLLGRKNRSPEGYGFSMDIWGEWQLKTYKFNVEARDLFHHLYWDNIAHTFATADTDIVQRDSNGFISLRPLVSGFEDYRSKTQNLEPRAKLKMQLPDSQYQAWILGIEHFHGHQFGQLGYRWNDDQGYRQIQISSRGPSLMVEWVKQRYKIAIAMDRWIDRAYSLTLNGAFKFKVF